MKNNNFGDSFHERFAKAMLVAIELCLIEAEAEYEY